MVENAVSLVVRIFLSLQMQLSASCRRSQLLFDRLVGMMPFSAIAMSSTIAPKIEIYTFLACSVHKPDIYYSQKLPVIGGIEGVIPVIDNSPIIPSLDQPQVDVTHDNLGMVHISNLTNAEDNTGPQACASDPVVQAAVAKLSAGTFLSFPIVPVWQNILGRRQNTLRHLLCLSFLMT